MCGGQEGLGLEALDVLERGFCRGRQKEEEDEDTVLQPTGNS